jgi:hypothetical protein
MAQIGNYAWKLPGGIIIVAFDGAPGAGDAEDDDESCRRPGQASF